MAFWGVDVRPGKPYTHSYDCAHGRLRICQATLSNFNATVRSVVQCNVGTKSPVILCSLNPKLAEMCRLEIELEEEEEVVFSVLGQSGVHLSGYYLRSSSSNAGDESESYGEDIGESDTENSEYDANVSEDKYESDFIDDGDIEMSPSPHKVVEKPTAKVARHRRLRKKHQVGDTDGNNDVSPCKPAVKRSIPSIFDSEDEDSLPISVSLSKKDTVKTAERSTHSNGKTSDEARKKKTDGTPSIFDSEDEDILPISVSLSKKENVKTAKTSTHSNGKTNDDARKRKSDVISQDPGSVRDLLETNGSLPSEQDAKKSGRSKKKRKIKDEKSPEIDSKSSADEKLKDQQCSNVDDTGVVDQMPESKEKDIALKKKKKEAKWAKNSEAPSPSAEHTEVDAKQGSNTVANADMEQDHAAEPEKLLNDNNGSNRKSKIHKTKAVKGDGVQEEEVPQNETPDKATDGSNQQSHEMNLGSNDNDPSALVTQQDLKKKKKRAKNHEKDLSINQEMRNPSEVEDGKQFLNMRTLDNGLIIEDLLVGKPDAKRASDGSKVSVSYVGKLQNGKIFDSNVGRKPFKFKLGAGKVIKGWDLGISGMCVGDKRRLTIPPDMGYGDNAEGLVPENSWLIFDVELVSVK